MYKLAQIAKWFTALIYRKQMLVFVAFFTPPPKKKLKQNKKSMSKIRMNTNRDNKMSSYNLCV